MRQGGEQPESSWMGFHRNTLRGGPVSPLTHRELAEGRGCVFFFNLVFPKKY